MSQEKETNQTTFQKTFDAIVSDAVKQRNGYIPLADLKKLRDSVNPSGLGIAGRWAATGLVDHTEQGIGRASANAGCRTEASPAQDQIGAARYAA